MIYVQPEISSLIETSLQELRQTELKRVHDQCPSCGYTINYPIMVRKGDLDHMKTLLKIINEYMVENGITEDLFKKLGCKIKDWTEIQKIINKNSKE